MAAEDYTRDGPFGRYAGIPMKVIIPLGNAVFDVMPRHSGTLALVLAYGRMIAVQRGEVWICPVLLTRCNAAQIMAVKALGFSFKEGVMENIEVFHVDAGAAVRHTADAKGEDTRMASKGTIVLPGWYWWANPSGRLSNPDFANGPYVSSQRARADALEATTVGVIVTHSALY